MCNSHFNEILALKPTIQPENSTENSIENEEQGDENDGNDFGVDESMEVDQSVDDRDESQIDPFRKFLRNEFGVDFSNHAFCRSGTSFSSLKDSTKRKKFWSAARIADKIFGKLCPDAKETLKENYCQRFVNMEKPDLPQNLLRQVDEIGEAIRDASTLRQKRYLLAHITFLVYNNLKKLGIQVGRKLFEAADDLVLKMPVEEKKIVKRFNDADIKHFVNFITRLVI